MINSNIETKLNGSDGVFYLGHASILVRLNGYSILMDPIVLAEPYSGSWTFFPPQYKDQKLHEVDAVVVSHIHQDHYDQEFLRNLSPSCQVFIIEGRESFENSLLKLNIKNLVFLKPNMVHEIFDQVYIFGLLHESNGIDASTIIYNENFSVYHGNDNYCSLETIKQFHEIVPEIDVACLPYAYIHWYPFLLVEELQTSERKKETIELIQKYMEHCILSARELRAKLVIPFGANLVLDNGDANSTMNLAVKTPLEFFDYVCNNHSDLSKIVLPLNAGDAISAGDDDLYVHREVVESSEQYRNRMTVYLQKRDNAQGSVSPSSISLDDFISKTKAKIFTANSSIDFEIWFELCLKSCKSYIRINPGANIVETNLEFRSENPFYLFKLDFEATLLWTSGSSFEEIIGTRRFELMRQPDEYRPDVLKFINTVL
jgi:L-ascorbate metabolism protein UlaG (beta-lactamase superfamily)